MIVFIYLHKHEGTLFCARSLEVECYRSDRKWLSIDVLNFADEPADVHAEDEVCVVVVALVAVDVIAHSGPASQHHAAPT